MVLIIMDYGTNILLHDNHGFFFPTKTSVLILFGGTIKDYLTVLFTLLSKQKRVVMFLPSQKTHKAAAIRRRFPTTKYKLKNLLVRALYIKVRSAESKVHQVW